MVPLERVPHISGSPASLRAGVSISLLRCGIRATNPRVPHPLQLHRKGWETKVSSLNASPPPSLPSIALTTPAAISPSSTSSPPVVPKAPRCFPWPPREASTPAGFWPSAITGTTSPCSRPPAPPCSWTTPPKTSKSSPARADGASALRIATTELPRPSKPPWPSPANQRLGQFVIDPAKPAVRQDRHHVAWPQLRHNCRNNRVRVSVHRRLESTRAQRRHHVLWVQPLPGRNRFQLEHAGKYAAVRQRQALHQRLLEDIPPQRIRSRF